MTKPRKSCVCMLRADKISRIARGGTLQQWNAGKDYGVANRCGTWSYGNFIGIMYALARDALACHKESQGPRYIPGQAWHFIQQRSCLNVGDHVVEPVLFCDGRRLWNTQVGIYYAHARSPYYAHARSPCVILQTPPLRHAEVEVSVANEAAIQEKKLKFEDIQQKLAASIKESAHFEEVSVTKEAVIQENRQNSNFGRSSKILLSEKGLEQSKERNNDQQNIIDRCCSKYTQFQVWISDLLCGSRSPRSRI